MNKALLSAAATAAVLFGVATAQAAAPPEAGPAAGGARQAGPPAPTPRLPNGKPDMSGFWGGNRGGGGGGGPAPAPDGGDEDAFATIGGRDGDLMNFENDSYINQKSTLHDRLPKYKPEFWEKVRDLDLRGNQEDPQFHCMPAGVPRQGAPNRIIAMGNRVMLFNGTTIRDIIVGKKWTREDMLIESWLGFPEARWEGDTLVVVSKGFNDLSWLGWGGYFHSHDMVVTETFKREGNTLTYTSVAEDPTVWTEPYRIFPNVTLNLNPNSATAFIAEATPCDERDAEDIVLNIRG